MFVHKREVPQSLLVPEYDHVHHADIVALLEKGRLALLENIGHPQDSLVARGLFPVITGLEVRFLREIREGGINVTCEDIVVEGRYIRMNQRITRPATLKPGNVSQERDKDLVRASIELMVIDKSVGKGIAIPEFLKESLIRGS